MPILDESLGRNLYTADEIDRRENPAKYKYSQADYDAFIARTDALAQNRSNVDQRAREAVPMSYTQFGTEGTNPVFSLGGFSGQSSGGLGGRAGLSAYEDGGVVESQGVGRLFEDMNRPAPMDPILEHHYKNLAQGKAVQHEDGTVSTVYTIQEDIDGVPTLIPTVWDGQILSNDAAIQRALASGKNWPTASTHDELIEYDIKLHENMQNMPAEAAQMMLMQR